MRRILPSCFLFASAFAHAQTGQIDVPAVEKMPDMPEPFVLRDWKKVARDFDAAAFDFQRTGEFLPLPWRDDSRVDHDLEGFALPAYVGDLRQTPASNNYDAITCLGAVLGATAAGIDKSDQNGTDWVEKLKIYFSKKNGTNLYSNNPGGRTGQSFWYELLPSLLFYQIYDRHRSDPEMKRQFLAIADRWKAGCAALSGEGDTADFDHTAFDFSTGKPFDNPRWKEPDAAAGVAWLEYMAHAETGERGYLEAAERAMKSLAERKENPFYECLMPYGAYLSARMNAEVGTTYPTGRFIGWVFDGDNPREWGAITEKWGAREFFGLLGSVHKGSEYAFAMNSFLAPAVMVPLVRYDDRYARAIGKWVLNVAVNSRYFYPNAWGPAEQTSWKWASEHDPGSAIAYEGVRKSGLQRDRPAGVARGERLVPGPDGKIARVWKIDMPEGAKQTLVISLKPRDESLPWNAEVSVAPSENGPWSPAFKFSPDGKNRKWLAVNRSGPLWISLRAEPADGQKPEPLSIGEIYVETRLDVAPQAGGDPIFHGWGRTDLGLYGSAFVGLLAALVEPTDVGGILRVDCRATEAFAPRGYPTFLYYNPHPETKRVRVAAGDQPADLYDAVSGKVVARDVRGETAISVAGDSAALIVICPAGGEFVRRDGRLENAGIPVDYTP